MSAALLLAAVRRNMGVQVTTGERRDLARVTDGTESVISLPMALIGIDRDIDTALSLAARFDYGAAVDVLTTSKKAAERNSLSLGKPTRKRLDHALSWSQCLHAWDLFDHRTAFTGLERGLDEGAPWAEAMQAEGRLEVLHDMAGDKAIPRVSLCRDLLANARRRFDQGRLDDALGRLYRFVEACVQTQLYRRWKLHSGALEADDLPEHLRNRAGKSYDYGRKREVLTLALDSSVVLLEHKDPNDPVAAAYRDEGGRHGPGWLTRRNNSILAHGYKPIDGKTVETALGWIDNRLVPAMKLEPMAQFPKTPFP